MPGDMTGPVRLCAIVEGHAIFRRPKAMLQIIGIKEFDKWQLCDRHGKAIAE